MFKWINSKVEFINRGTWAAYCGANAILRATQERERVAMSNCALARQETARWKDEAHSMRGFHDASIKEMYRMLGVDGSDGEYRFKWVALEMENKLRELAAANLRINELERAQFVTASK